jgi:spore coat polysaccharide biosynthesis predicted glycosyltransferase SpsG
MKRAGAKYLTLISKSDCKEPIFSHLGENPMPFPCNKPSLWVRTVASPEIGFGHLRRSVTLGRILSDVLHPVFICDSADRWTQAEAEVQGWSAKSLDHDDLWFSTPGPAGLLIDTREEDGLASLIATARDRSIPVFSIHDLGLNPLPSDVVIDGSIFPVTHGFPRRETAFYTGTAYLVLDPTFGLIHQQRKRIRGSIQSVVVNLGGGNSSRYFEKVLNGLKMWGRDLDVVGMPGFSDWGQEQLANKDWAPLKFRWAQRSEPVERLLFRADLAVTAGGLAAFEAMCAGTPLLALSFDDFQNLTISMLARADACIDLGEGDLLKPASIPPIVAPLDGTPAQREKLSFNGRQIVDGRGAERVSRVIRRLVGSAAVGAHPMVV